MRTILFPALILIASSVHLTSLTTGRSCLSKSSLIVTDFTVNPYPPQSGSSYEVALTGIFSKTEYIYDLEARSSYDGQKYTSLYFPVNKTCSTGPIYSFNASLTAGNLVGLYDVQILLESKRGTAISCWDFTYHITS